MIVCRVEFWPDGNSLRAREIGRIAMENKSDMADVSNYQVLIREEANPMTKSNRVDREFMIDNHLRRQSVFALIARAAQKFCDLG